ncbi:hypothetical protein PHET_03066 [Paragonimus heterotremus]|uniref:HTH La-type RNA-binding domain-containing protein n=1 Tax=Paragonimus heterotremus TaxID=100268 RepID=A0A8J4T166_9TREM|nr:hypothetical protein PHET_03066 [Paragonimus heterotremus]
MGENLTAKFAQLNANSEKSNENEGSPVSFNKVNGEEQCKGNPWKPISSSENNCLEADAWPEPSAPGEQRRNVSLRQFDEKPKRKIKWQNYEVDQPTGFSRGRGRGFSVQTYGPSNMHPLRRGGFRGRGSFDMSRNPRTNGYYARHSIRMPNIRPPVETRPENSVVGSDLMVDEGVCNAVGVSGADSEIVTCDPARKSGEQEQNSPDGSSSPPTTNITTSSPTADSASKTSAHYHANKAVGTPKRSYRDRTFPTVVCQSSQDPSAPANYEAGPVGRARRSYLRQHQPAFTSEQDCLSTPHAVASNAAIQPLIPFQSLPPFTYYIPGATGMGGALWGPSLQLSPAQPVSIPGVNPNQLPQVHALPQLSVDQTAGPVPGAIQRVLTAAPTSNTGFSKVTTTSEVQAEVVDIDQMITFIDNIGWKNVIFPTCLREHPAVASLLRTATGQVNVDDSNGSASINEDVSLRMKEETTTENRAKSDDVVIVEDRVFFVPRNANKTKFVKFTSKVDYIRHHVEHYFSESNLNRDAHLVSILEANQGICPIADLLQFNRLRWISTTKEELLDAVFKSPLLTITYTPNGCPVGIRRIAESSVDQTVSFHTDALHLRPVESIPTSSPNALSGVNKSDFASKQNFLVASSVGSHSDSSQSIVTSNQSSLPSSDLLTDSSLNRPCSFPPVSSHTVHSPLIAAPQLHQFIQSPALLLNPISRMELTGVPTGSVHLSGQGPNPNLPQYFPQSDISGSMNPTTAQHFGYNHPTFYSPQAAALAAAASNHPTLIHPPGVAAVQPPETGAAFMPAFYRIATPGHPSTALGAYLSQSNASGFTSSNPAVLLHFLPTPTPTQNAGYLTQSASCPGPAFNRAMGAVNSGGVWIPLAAGNNNCSQPMTSIAQTYQTLLTIPTGHTSLSGTVAGGNGSAYSTVAGGSSFGAFPTQGIEVAHTGQLEQKIDMSLQSYAPRHVFKNFNNSHSIPCSTHHSTPSPVVHELSSSVSSYSSLNRGSTNHSTLPHATNTMTAVSQQPVSSHSTPKKVSVAANP